MLEACGKVHKAFSIVIIDLMKAVSFCCSSCRSSFPIGTLGFKVANSSWFRGDLEAILSFWSFSLVGSYTLKNECLVNSFPELLQYSVCTARSVGGECCVLKIRIMVGSNPVSACVVVSFEPIHFGSSVFLELG